MFYGEDPPKDMVVDHINRVRTDNRITNLRLCSHSDNARNQVRKPRKPRVKKTAEELKHSRKNAAQKIAQKVRKKIKIKHPDGTVIAYESQLAAAQAIGCSPSTINYMKQGGTCRGYTIAV
jgi:hypothetical protein